MGCCEVLMKAILIITNVVVLVAGAALLVAGGVFYAKKFDFFPELEDYSTNVNTVLIPMMVIGAVLFLVGVIGCCGAITGKSGLLNVYFVVVLIVVILEIVIIILGVVKKGDFVEYTEKYSKELFDEYKKEYITDKDGKNEMDATKALAVNTAQFVFSCCGLTSGPNWWTGGQTFTKIPPGCCAEWKGEDIGTGLYDVNADGKCLVGADKTESDIYKEGCTEKVKSLANDFEAVIIIVIVAVIVFEIICLAAACYSKKNDMVA